MDNENDSLYITSDKAYDNLYITNALKGWLNKYSYNDGWSSTISNAYTTYMNDFTGVVVQHYDKGKLIKEDCFDYNEKNKEEMQKIEDDIRKKQKEFAESAVYRLSNVYADNKGLIKSAPDGNIIYCTEEVLNELANGVKRTVYLSIEVAEFCSGVDAKIFDGWNVVLIDDTKEVDMTDLPKNLDFKDETPEEVVQNIRDKTSELRRAQKIAIEEVERDDALDSHIGLYKKYF
ncbi:MAG: hypothetical protein II304_06135 [Bacteroidales bacterium]|nr:hypothetical protein [Bacteroidales bacterium]